MLSFYVPENFEWVLRVCVVVDIGDLLVWANHLDFSEKTELLLVFRL